MPISFDFESHDEIALAKGEGSISIEEIRNASKAFWGWASGPLYRVLWDLRTANLDLAAREIRELATFAATMAPSSGEIRSAYVVSSDLEFGLLRIFEMVREADGVHTLVTRDLQTAIDWLRENESRG